MLMPNIIIIFLELHSAGYAGFLVVGGARDFVNGVREN